MPLNVGGMPIVVAPGEQVAVFNRHQLPVVNEALAGYGYGGLEGLFGSINRPNYMASGGVVGHVQTPKVSGVGTLSEILRAGLRDVAGAANSYLHKHAGASRGGPHGGGGTHSQNEALGRRMMIAAGFPAGEWPFLQALWTQESGWDANAVNSSSGAYGIPQSLGHGHPYNLGDASAQIAWGLNDIRERYGSPSAAEAHERSAGWYARGGMVSRFSKGTANAHKHGKKPRPGLPHKARHLRNVNVNAMHFDAFRLIPSLAQMPESFNQKLGLLNHILGSSGSVAKRMEMLEVMQGKDERLLGSQPFGGAFIVTENEAGETVPAYEDTANVSLRRSQSPNWRQHVDVR